MIRNYCRLDALNLASIFGNESLKFIPSNYLSSGISIDTRTIEAGNIFIALKGSKLDGHAKIDEAMANGASAVIVEESFIESIAIDYPHIIVNDTLEALGMLAKYHRRLFDYPVIAIAGSNGKTTTKEFTAHLLASRFNVLKTHENFNNRLGVPLMLLTMTQEHEAAVIEIATNEPGEISILSDILQPTHGLITNIGEEHLEKLIDLTGVEVEESYLFGYLLKHDGTCFINTDDSRLAKYSKIIEKKVEYGTRPTAQVKANIIYNEMMIPTLRIKFEDRKIKANLKTTGRTTALNALAAASIGIGRAHV